MATDSIITLRLNPELLERAQVLADKAGISRHKFLTNLIETGIEATEDLDRIGILRVAILSRNFQEAMTRAALPTSQEPTRKE